MSLHFIRPEWLLALLPLTIILWMLWRQHQTNSAWNRYIAPHLAKILVTEGSQKSRRPLYILAFSWFIAVLALAGPALNKQSLPVFAAEQGRVLVMDMSVSMFATDLTPNRLTQAKFRATDLLRGLKEGETGLIAFAGDAFTISPLTRDTGTLLNLLPTLSPEIMPVLGSNLAAALTQAKNLLAQGGHLRGDIIVMTDGITPRQFDEANSVLTGSQYRLAIMGFGSNQGAPIRLPDGQLQKDSSNEVVVAKTDFGLLQKLADNHNGTMIPNRADGEDLVQLQHWLSDSGDAKATDIDGETWQDLGPYLALLLLIPALLSFRQGMLASWMLMGFASLILGALPQNAHANAWDTLWHTQEQQAMRAYQAEDYANAAQKFETPQWQGAAQYKAGDFEHALKTFEQDNSANGLYNQGNALMQLGKPDKAKERYQAALDKQPDFPQAKANLELAEKLQEQQQSQQNADNQDKQSQGDQNQQGQNQNDQQQGQNQQQDQQKEQQSSQNDQAQDPSQDEQPQEQQPDQADENPSQDQDTSSEQQDNAEPDAQDKQQDADKAQRDQQEAKNEQQQAQQEANQQNSADNNAEDNAEEQASNEAQMQAKVADDKSNTEQEQQQALAQKADKEKQSKADKDTETAISETLEAPPSNSEPLPAEMQRALRGVSEDPQVLLRNKMQLEYQKRRQNGQISRDNEQW
ncbi:vWA domain-containing protein [Shewanella xiamenensis]|uniref:vWA domain-containing protein n=1 Tax=Shewanella xiamenensis TaxID=332186 RepID=UPI0024A64C98|nr:VWA domain-containing protein [Shewanella xiamenensis]MDI5834987.1 VWA domain-containing protein [Shewanella xiamenensis]MDI5839240.1 VWA domain-containing protein [Shewanella xiamenensis]MDI5845476.1 VWA domain-containing protein [Shewanella xiamenensis]MDI5847798.1 VWA domain-containing protein [Shewanella xiamenensis]MDI5853431.1 VWA domain-containing protein [Shewanella xiamenensis]